MERARIRKERSMKQVLIRIRVMWSTRMKKKAFMMRARQATAVRKLGGNEGWNRVGEGLT